jgi:hypothetical protein
MMRYVPPNVPAIEPYRPLDRPTLKVYGTNNGLINAGKNNIVSRDVTTEVGTRPDAA